ncbi:hypothetical protein Fmac_015395 [Flemingia macrophylla]|uniref:Uncharacterized protein n=1 Tax=Flemingia macrophylla TaxID=520843 RepID=A0ABD1MEG2_9FABA
MGFWVSLIFVVRIQLGQGSAAQVTTTMLKNEGVAAFYKVILLFSLIMDPLCDDCGVLLLLVLIWPNGVCCVSFSCLYLPDYRSAGLWFYYHLLIVSKVNQFIQGLSAGLLRQATYTTARLGSFKILTSKAIEVNDGKSLPLYHKALCGLTAGAIGAYCASSISGFFAAACSLPFDYVKTQIQKMQPDAEENIHILAQWIVLSKPSKLEILFTLLFLVAFLLLIVLLDSHSWSSL